MGIADWDALPVELQDIVWTYCGDLRDLDNRNHKFLGLELKVWGMLRGRLVDPSYLRRQYRCFGLNRLKEILQLAYMKSQRETFLKDTLGSYEFVVPLEGF